MLFVNTFAVLVTSKVEKCSLVDNFFTSSVEVHMHLLYQHIHSLD